MKRKIYFFLEQLEISRSERITVTILLSLILMFSGIYYYHEPMMNYDPDHYENLERIFREKSEQVAVEREGILARYQPSIEITSINNQAAIESIVGIENEKSKDTVAEVGNMMERSLETDPIKIPDIININTASEEQLVTLPGIGPAYARRIIEWREENGRFTQKEQLLEIRGIGARRLEQIIPFIEL